MRPDDLLAWVHAAPFQPFRICLNSGRTYEIRHPEMPYRNCTIPGSTKTSRAETWSAASR
jgi:hypothetical protein